MALFGRGRPGPRLAPELDDAPLGRVLKSVATARGVGPQDLAIAQVERLLRETGDDWDRRSHRVGVLAHAAPSLARHWRERRPHDPDALVLAAWAELAADPWQALALSRAAAQARPEDPTPWVGALAAVRLLGRPSAEVLPVWAEIRARDPWHREAHLQALGYLSPEEQGSHSALRDFLDDITALMPPDAPAACLPLTAAVRQYHRDLDGGGIVRWGRAATGPSRTSHASWTRPRPSGRFPVVSAMPPPSRTWGSSPTPSSARDASRRPAPPSRRSTGW
ncbi:hypothetical protein [Streptomyces justiciae]|uniref:hypothetical protein n=1 Tax=Streptomyces justiciae TaxID=2780140 RepID=UPI0021196556|nr:hypothetical protein [Streptomyces justiciae]MCW8380736.1 hypothetical protein [Streptomyces justiciae]